MRYCRPRSGRPAAGLLVAGLLVPGSVISLVAAWPASHQATPDVLAPGVISMPDSHDDYIALSPDGRTAVFTRLERGYRGGTLYVAERIGDAWSPARPAPFSGEHVDSRAAFSPDGQRLFFASNRPHPERGSSRQDLDVWRVDRAGDGWSSPERLGPAINTEAHESHPSQAANGTLYFVRRTDDSDIFAAAWANGQWARATAVREVNSDRPDSHVFVDPAERYLLFARIDDTPTGEHDEIYLARRSGDGWSRPVKLPAPLNTAHYDYSARVYGDPARVYWTRNGQWTNGTPADILSLPVAAVALLREAHPSSGRRLGAEGR